jgi:hypothetical protein
LGTLSFARDQITQAAQSREVLGDELFIFHPNAAIAFHKGDQPDETQRIDLERFIRIRNRWQRRSAGIDVIDECLWYFHFGFAVKIYFTVSS